jgi:hypothetical protein
MRSTIASEGHARDAEHASTETAGCSCSITLLCLRGSSKSVDTPQEPATSVCITSEGQLLII